MTPTLGKSIPGTRRRPPAGAAQESARRGDESGLSEGASDQLAAELKAFLAAGKARVDHALDEWLAAEPGIPDDLRAALRYSVAAGGKRIRPLLCLLVAEGLGSTGDGVLRAACALELLHTYSLIHDDLPALDNDDLRRGRPTSHKVFGEATAILAGDALQALAFAWLAGAGRQPPAAAEGGRASNGRAPAASDQGAAPGLPPERVLEAVQVLAAAAGPAGMVGGQLLDMAAAGRAVSLDHLRTIHRGKTGALLAAAVEIGAVLAGATGAERAGLRTCGEELGLLFQIVDDILDVVGAAAELGKTPGKDAQQGKATYPAVVGLDEAQRLAREAHARAVAAARALPRPLPLLVAMADHLLARTS